MKRKNNVLFLLLVLLIIQISIFNTAFCELFPPLENYRIILSWSTFESELEAVLIVPDIEADIGIPLSGSIPGETANQYVSSTGDVSPEPSITQETFIIHKFCPGTYQLWVKSKFVEEGFGDSDLFNNDGFSIFSNSEAKVEVSDNDNLIKTIKLGSNPHGLVWLPLEIDGSTKKPVEVNKFYEHLRTIHGSIIDAVTGNPLEGTLIIVKNRDSRETVGRKISDKNGEVIITVDPGRYVVYIGKKSYISDKFDIDVIHSFPRTVQAVLTKIIPNLNYRIILTWGRFPIDLDAHLKGPNPNHEDFHIYWNRRTLIKGKKYLDRDDRNSYGPETITIRGINPGEYTYTVHSYSGRYETSGDAMSEGNVEVRVYNRDKLLKKYHMPRGSQGNYWKVFELDGKTGEIIDINQTGFESDPDKL